jgi:uncharacterized glyoxalase superfamily protein PhnB
MTAVLKQVDVIGEDVAALVRFYRALGVDIPDEGIWKVDGTAHHTEVALPGGVQLGINSLALTNGYAPGWDVGGPVLIFEQPTRKDVDDHHRNLTDAGYRSLVAPFDAFWGGRFAVVEDPAGHAVGLMSSSDGPHTDPPTL